MQHGMVRQVMGSTWENFGRSRGERIAVPHMVRLPARTKLPISSSLPGLSRILPQRNGPLPLNVDLRGRA